ncbi:MAG: sulfite oxidase-like oxidoreductase [Actinobacteria bacterium]|nr:MAG: sulfite oxidase-like oxidoreductase [Actinomycetota bacterium]
MDEKTIIKSPDTKREKRLPPGQHETEKWPTLQAGQIPQVEIKNWTFEIYGEVEERKKLNFKEFMDLPRVRVFSDIHCVTTWSRLDNLWEGVSSRVIAEKVSLKQTARFVLVHSVGGYSTNLRIGDFLQEDVLFAIRHDDKVLEPKHGFPVRLVVPRLYFWKSAKWVRGVEFLQKEVPGFWESRGYHRHGDPWKEQRYSDV